MRGRHLTGVGVWQVQSAKEQYFSDLQSLQQDEAQDAVLKKKQDEEAAQEELYQVSCLCSHTHSSLGERSRGRQRG